MREIDKPRAGEYSKISFIQRMTMSWRSAMRKSALTIVTRAYFFLGALLVIAFFLTVGPYIAEQTINIWMAFGVGLALIAYGRTNIRLRHDSMR